MKRGILATRKFKRGDTVLQTDAWVECEKALNPNRTISPKYGTVVGFSRDGLDVRVVTDGYKTPVNWSPDFWKLASTASYPVNAGCSPECEDCKSELDAMDAVDNGTWKKIWLFIRRWYSNFVFGET